MCPSLLAFLSLDTPPPTHVQILGPRGNEILNNSAMHRGCKRPLGDWRGQHSAEDCLSPPTCQATKEQPDWREGEMRGAVFTAGAPTSFYPACPWGGQNCSSRRIPSKDKSGKLNTK